MHYNGDVISIDDAKQKEIIDNFLKVSALYLNASGFLKTEHDTKQSIFFGREQHENIKYIA